MNWWNEHKKPLIPLFVVLFLLAFSTIVLLGLYNILIGNVFCTMVDEIGNGITVYVENVPHPIKSYEITVDYPYPIASDKIVCDESLLTNIEPDLLDGSDFDQCFLGGAFFAQKEWKKHPPKTVSITVIIEGQKVTRRFQPGYSLHYPNGEQCSPAYYSTIFFEFGK